VIRNLKITAGKYFRDRKWSAVGAKNIPTLQLLPPALGSASLIKNTELSGIRLALEQRKRIRPAKGVSLDRTQPVARP